MPVGIGSNTFRGKGSSSTNNFQPNQKGKKKVKAYKEGYVINKQPGAVNRTASKSKKKLLDLSRVVGQNTSGKAHGHEQKELVQVPSLGQNFYKLCDPLTPRQVPQTQISSRQKCDQMVCKTQRDMFPRSSTGYLNQIPGQTPNQDIVSSEEYNCTTMSRDEDTMMSAPQELESLNGESVGSSSPR